MPGAGVERGRRAPRVAVAPGAAGDGEGRPRPDRREQPLQGHQADRQRQGDLALEAALAQGVGDGAGRAEPATVAPARRAERAGEDQLVGQAEADRGGVDLLLAVDLGELMALCAMRYDFCSLRTALPG